MTVLGRFAVNKVSRRFETKKTNCQKTSKTNLGSKTALSAHFSYVFRRYVNIK